MTDYLIPFIIGFRIQDFFDIIIISTLIYVVLIWFKDTASRFVFAGISLLGAIYIIARIFHLYLTSMVLQGFFTILLIALVVIFQEDIRRFFERLATWRSIKKSGRKEESKDLPVRIEAIVESIAEFASKKIGALVVLQGMDHLERHLKGGYELDGVLSYPLLASIFDKHSIGHDGAVIINNGRVIQFGCHLPLCLDTEKIGKYGLRHTAALGLSQLSDALCIIVSEERGTISFAREGKLKHLKNAAELSTIIKKYYQDEIPTLKQHIPFQWIRKNTLEKAIALLLTLILWFFLGYQKDSIQRDLIVPIEYRNISQEWDIEESRYNEATITIIGSSQAFNLFDPSTLKISVDLSNLTEGKQEISLSSEMIRIPSNISLVKIQPGKINITAHKLYQFEVPVHVKTSDSLPTGYSLKNIRSNPEYINILVQKRLMNGKLYINTEPVDLSGITSDTVIECKIDYPAEVHFKNNQIPSVKVIIEVEDTRKSRK